jgi:hypothetical protein
MTNEQLRNGAKLAEQIGALEAQLDGWKRATRFTYENVTLYSEGEHQCFDKIKTSYIDFDVMKTLTIARIEKELNELKTEFEKL